MSRSKANCTFCFRFQSNLALRDKARDSKTKKGLAYNLHKLHFDRTTGKGRAKRNLIDESATLLGFTFVIYAVAGRQVSRFIVHLHENISEWKLLQCINHYEEQPLHKSKYEVSK